MAAKPNEIQITRVYDAPVKLVWEAWADLKQLEKWWGPRGFTITTKSKELRPGGKWIFTMHGPDGTDYPNITTYHEVIPYEKLVYDHGGNEERDKLFTVTVTFRENKGKTTMVMTMALPSAEAAKATKKFVKEANGNSTWDRLAEYLEDRAHGKDVFITHRTFAAGIKTVFDMWVNPEHLSRWLPPKGSTMAYLKTDVREGGSTLYSMTNAAGEVMHGQLSFRKINPHTELVYTNHFADQTGKLTKPPFASDFPDYLLTTVTLAEEDGGETRVSVRWEVFGEATSAERALFHGMKAGMMEGWNGSFDKLEHFIGEQK